jgi:hypothetical protein
MKRFEEIIERIDYRIDKSFGSFFIKIVRHFSIFSSLILLVLLALFIYKVMHNRAYYLSSVIEQDVTIIAKVLASIDKDCGILSLSREHLPVNFLTVKSFVGSSVGGLNLAYPQKWQGPYLQINPTHQERFYDLIQTNEGLFLLPGLGVSLPSGLVMGRDVKPGFDVSIKKMLEKGGVLNHDGSLLGLQLNFKVGDWDPKFKASKSTCERINILINEFNQAMPFAKNEDKVFGA